MSEVRAYKPRGMALRKNGEAPPPQAAQVVPKNETAEKAAIACMLTMADPLSVPLTEGHFFFPDHKLIFRAIYDLAKDGTPVNIMTVRALLESREQLENAGGDPSRFYDCVGGGNAVLRYYFNMLEDARKNRDILLHIFQNIEDLTKLRVDAADFVRQLNELIDGQ